MLINRLTGNVLIGRILCQANFKSWKIQRLSKGYHKRKTYESNQVEYTKGETPLVEVPRSYMLVTDI